ncbi:1-phosphofructokinase [Enterocloster citroniae]|uniref:1-phosphofructokinase n=1 Tax=Enterocloster citroniae TaxID=358743 RepID=UPI00349EA56E
MIGTVTLNTAIDKRYIINRFSMGDVNRVKECRYTAGGKGINVSRVARLAGENVMATGFVGGHAGDYIIQEIQRQGITPFFVHTEGESRSCINLFDCETHRQTELLEPGEFVTDEEQKQLLDHVDTMASQCDVITVSGSAPKGVSPKLYSDIIDIAKKRGKKVLLDTSGEMLKQSLKSGPYLIKPNGDEIKSLTGISPETEEQVIHEAKKLRRMKVEIVVISLGVNGSVIACNEGVYRVRVPAVESVNTVGCGDSMMAGLAVGIARGYGVEHLIRYASAVSVANALQEQTGFIDMSDVERLIPEVDIELLGT